MQIKRQLILKHRFIIFFFFLWLVFFVFPLLGLSQTASDKENADVLKRPNIEYTATDFRDPFYPQIFITEEEEPKVEEFRELIKYKPSELFSFTIQGIIWNPDNPMVIINNQVCKKGDDILMQSKKGDSGSEKINIIDIERDGVTIIYSGEMEKLPYHLIPK